MFPSASCEVLYKTALRIICSVPITIVVKVTTLAHWLHFDYIATAFQLYTNCYLAKL